jgi:hypothetical protein
MGIGDFHPSEAAVDEFLDLLEQELGISLSNQERQLLRDYTRQSPNLTPENILQKVLTIAKQKTERLSEEKIKNARKRSENSNLFKNYLDRLRFKKWTEKKPTLTKTKDKRLTDKDNENIIKEAEKKLIENKKLRRKLTDGERKKAIDEFKKNINPDDSPLIKANQALLGVLKVGMAGAIRIVVQYSWGNLLNVPDYNPYHGMSTLDQGDRIDLSRGDALGVEAHAIITCIKAGALRADFFNKLEQSLNIKPDERQEPQRQAVEDQQKETSSKSKLPTLEPRGAHPGEVDS